MRVIIDADACPRAAMAAVERLRARFGYELVSVSSFNHVHERPNHVTVGDEDQATDLALINMTRRGDLIVTQDWGLAALALGRGAFAIDPGGRVFAEDKMGFLLEERNLKARYRRGGGRTRGPSARTREDDRRFTAAFLGLLQNLDPPNPPDDSPP